jgi:hypothetical protein
VPLCMICSDFFLRLNLLRDTLGLLMRDITRVIAEFSTKKSNRAASLNEGRLPLDRHASKPVLLEWHAAPIRYR